MGRAPCCSKVGLHRGPWAAREDKLLINYIQTHGEGHWRSLPKKAGLLRCGKSCRLRWMNYLRPDIKRGNITSEEDDLIIRLHSLLGNRWSLIAGRLPGRTDNEIKNYWNSHLSKRLNNNDTAAGNKSNCIGPSASAEKRSDSSKLKNKKKQKELDIEGGSSANEETAPTKTKIHLPKATRVSPNSVARNFMTTDHAGASSDANRCMSSADLRVVNYNDGEAMASNMINEDFDFGLVNHHDYDFSCQNYLPTNDNMMLDEMFEEYHQLLEADDHAELLDDSFVDTLLS